MSKFEIYATLFKRIVMSWGTIFILLYFLILGIKKIINREKKCNHNNSWYSTYIFIGSLSCHCRVCGEYKWKKGVYVKSKK